MARLSQAAAETRHRLHHVRVHANTIFIHAFKLTYARLLIRVRRLHHVYKILLPTDLMSMWHRRLELLQNCRDRANGNLRMIQCTRISTLKSIIAIALNTQLLLLHGHQRDLIAQLPLLLHQE